jgi:predicted dehydrogenase
MTTQVATIGGGTFGEMHLRGLTQAKRSLPIELAGLADVNADIRELRADQYDVPVYDSLDNLLASNDLHAVTIATPDHLHASIAIECLNRGIHVFVEKPMATTVEDCEAMVAAAEANDCILHVDFMKRLDPYHVELKRVVDTGGIGDIEYGYAWMEDRIEVPRDWLPKWASESSPAWFVGVHYYDMIRWMVGQDAVAVSATGVKNKLQSIGIDTYDSIQAKIVFEGGISFAVDTSWHIPDGNEAVVNQGIKIVGSDGWLTVDSQDRGARGCIRSGDAPSSMHTPNLGFFKESEVRGVTRYSGYAVDAMALFLENVLALRSGEATLSSLGDSYPTGVDGLEVTRIAVGVHESIATGGQQIQLRQT